MEWWLAFTIIVGALCALMTIGMPIAFAFLAVNIVGAWYFWGGVAGVNQMVLSRSAFGGPLSDQGVVRAQIAESRMEIEQARLLVLRTAWLIDEVGGKLITSYGMLTEALRRRRVEASPADRFVERLFGLELTQATYDRGSAFVSGVVERAGEDGLRRLWTDSEHLPTPNEIDAPGLWLARIDL